MPPKWKKYCTADVSIFSKEQIDRFYSALDSDIDALKQADSSKNTKKSTLDWIRVFNHWKKTHSHTDETYTYQPEDLHLIFEKF